ncbi:MAG TPA: MATE family efflux transporter [Candidatus Obscuribacterales bacterium]
MKGADEELESSGLAPAGTEERELPPAATEKAVPETAIAEVALSEAPLVSGSLWKAIWVMSWPLLLTTLAGSIVGLVDVQVSGLLGAPAQAAVGLAEQLIFIFMIFLMSMGVGTTAIVSRAYGKKDLAEGDFATGQSLMLSVVTGLVLLVVALAAAHFAVPLFSKAPLVISQCDLYLTVYSLYLVPFSLVCISNAAFRAIGNARVPLLVVCTEVIINIAGDYLTVVYNWPVPGLGVRGIALSATVGAVAAAVVALLCVQRSRLKGSLRQLWPLSLDLVRRILDVGIPSAFQRLSWALSVFGLFAILSSVPNPTAALASWTVGMRVESLLFMPQMALSLAVSSIVGQSLGAKHIERAFKAGWSVSQIALCMIGTLSVGIFVFARQLASLMSHDAATIEYTTTYLQINAIGEPFLSVNSALSGALQGAGDTKITMWIALFSHWVVRLPLAWLLADKFGMGVNGVWTAMATSVVVSTALIVIRFQSGAWVHKRV